MLLTGGTERRTTWLRGRRLRTITTGLALTAVVAAGCTVSPDGSVDQSTRPVIRPTATTTPGTPTTAAPAPAPAGRHRLSATAARVGDCPMFPPDHYLNAVNIDELPVHPRSNAWLDDMGRASTVDFPSSTVWDGARGGMPVNVVDSRETGFTAVMMNPFWPSSYYGGRYPLPSNPRVQGYPSAQWDRHLLIVDTAECMAYELIQYDTVLASLGVHSALSGARYPLDSTDRLPTSTNAPKTPMLGQYVLDDEVAAGEVPHVMAFCSNRISTRSVWPAKASDGAVDSTGTIPMGAWVRLRSNVDTSRFGPQAKVVAAALRERGAVLTDTCGHRFHLMAENSGEWNNADMDSIEALDMSDFEVVDASGLAADGTSFRIR